MNKNLLRKKLALMLANLRKKRPYYCEVEYLETTNQQTDAGSTNAAAYIDTGIIPNNNTRIECRMQFTTLISGQSNEALNGTTSTGQGTAPRFAWGFASVSPYTNFYFGLGAQNLTTSVTRDTNVHTFVLDAKNKTCSIDDTTNSFTSSGSIDSIRSIYLFARHATTEYANKPCNAKIYRYRNWDNDLLVQDLIPVLDWDFVPCMYDRTTGQFFYNAGTGTFSYGREIHYVDYLESTGTQYINTGVYLTNNHSVEIDYQLTATGQSRTGLFGNLNTARYGSLFSPSNKLLEHGYGAGNDYWQQGAQDTNRHVFKQEKNKIYVDGALVYTFSQATFNVGVSAPLGNFGYTNYTPAKAIYRYSKWWDGDTLVRDYLPAIDENGVGFMFDRVSHTCFLNAGSGAFKYPPVELEYLESSGTQYINTGITTWDNTLEYEIKLGIRQQYSTRTYFGCYDSWGGTGKIVPAPNTFVTNYRMQNNFNTGFISSSGYEIGIEHGQLGVLSLKENVLSWSEGSSIEFDRGASFTKTDLPILLFGSWYSNGAQELASFPLHYAKIWLDGSLIRDFIPVFKDGAAGMWDKENSVFYPNAGTGTFGVGKIVEPEYE